MSATKSKPGPTKSLTAHFIPTPAATVVCSGTLGAPTISPDENNVGDVVTLGFNHPILPTLNGNKKNLMISFDHWEDQDGNIISYDSNCKVVIPKEGTVYKAVTRDFSEMPQKGHFYRVRHNTNRVLTIQGGYSKSVSNDTIDRALLCWSWANNTDPKDFPTPGNISVISVESTPATVFYVKEVSSKGTELSISAQGANTKDLVKQTFDAQPMTLAHQGYYALIGTGPFGVKAALKINGSFMDNLHIGSYSEADQSIGMALQPIDEEHMDFFWFGAEPDPTMFFEGAYWTSMYTEFPYECRDGVEAYYVKELPAGGQEYIKLERVPGDLVPANFPVVLKCKSLSSKENRLLPIDPASPNAPKISDRNYLRGSFELYKNKGFAGRTTFERTKMRLLTIDSEGRVGFHEMTPDDAPELLPANRAYILVSDAPGLAASLPITYTKPAATAATSIPYGTATVTPALNKVGETITLSFTEPEMPRYPTVKNAMVEFSHWEDAEGNKVSESLTFETTAKEGVYVAVIKDNTQVPEVGKFYRVRNFSNRVLTFEGNYEIEVPASGGSFIDQNLMRWAIATDHIAENFGGISYPGTDGFQPVTPDESPATIVYIAEGTANDNRLEKAVLKVQGIDSKSIMFTGTGSKKQGTTLDFVPMKNSFYGYYGFQSSAQGNAGVKMIFNNGRCDAYLGSFGEEDPFSALALQPIDEAHINDFWFGALPAEDMVYEEGYWTTMYTDFPYECRDGVEAYYINKFGTYGDIEYAEMMPVPGNVVPAGTAVLLKCTGLTTKENRLLPLDPAVHNIPELPDNMLRGEFQLYTNANGEGRKEFNPETMRLLSVNADGRPSFIRMDATARGTAPEFIPANQAYIVFPSAQEAANHSDDLPIISQSGISGLDVIVTDTDNEGDGIYYNVFGQPVSHPVKGQIYIRNHKKIIF